MSLELFVRSEVCMVSTLFIGAFSGGDLTIVTERGDITQHMSPPGIRRVPPDQV